MSMLKPELRLRGLNPDHDFSALLQLLTEIQATEQAGFKTPARPGCVPSSIGQATIQARIAG